MTGDKIEDSINIRRLATMLDCSVDTAYRRANSGEIPGFRLGRAWRFFPSQVRAALEKQPDEWAYLKGSRRSA